MVSADVNLHPAEKVGWYGKFVSVFSVSRGNFFRDKLLDKDPDPNVPPMDGIGVSPEPDVEQVLKFTHDHPCSGHAGVQTKLCLKYYVWLSIKCSMLLLYLSHLLNSG